MKTPDRQSQLLSTLLEIAHKMNSSVKLDEILTEIVEAAKKYVGVSRVSVFLKDGEDTVSLRACAGFSPELPVVISLGEGITGTVAKTGQEFVVNHSKSSSNEYEASSFLSSPIRSGNTIIGVLNLTNKDNDFFDDIDIQIAEYIAAQCALAVERNSLYTQLVQAERLKTIGLLRASIVHDIRNMLGIVESYLALVEDDPSVDTINEYFLAIRSEIDRVQNLANDMLDYSKYQITLNFSTFNLDELCQQVASEINLSLKYTEVSVKSESKSGTIAIHADEERLFRVIFNLINNAVQAINDKGVVIVRCRKVGDYALILVCDTGKGIPKRIQKTIFEPFQGFDKEKSTGLGLSIVSDIIKAHHGTIKLRSAEKRYTLFRIKLPLNYSAQ